MSRWQWRDCFKDSRLNVPLHRPSKPERASAILRGSEESRLPICEQDHIGRSVKQKTCTRYRMELPAVGKRPFEKFLLVARVPIFEHTIGLGSDLHRISTDTSIMDSPKKPHLTTLLSFSGPFDSHSRRHSFDDVRSHQSSKMATKLENNGEEEGDPMSPVFYESNAVEKDRKKAEKASSGADHTDAAVINHGYRFSRPKTGELDLIAIVERLERRPRCKKITLDHRCLGEEEAVSANVVAPNGGGSSSPTTLSELES
ncbi:hypothetical protein BU16DRAFT_535497 [Lophium mytilinum]|uniref:Uncharacterized protein n=1 Tax=Lophium mytilinum TaxID=390894 RepID=A0A6A6R5T0_9PEZI|nr:hypothetical protein BU16DRAFT_535497 [Lophium mytilinum]